jgi:IS4 transposase
LWMIIQKTFRIKPEKYFKIEWYINIVFFVLLMWLWLYIIFLDLKRWWGVDLWMYVQNIWTLITGLFQ